MLPHSKIKKHRHLENWEIYINLTTGGISICQIGEEHDLANETDEIMKVVYLKCNDGTKIPPKFLK